MARLKEFYKKEVIKKLQKQLNIKNVMEIPKLKKITLNMGVGTTAKDKKVMESTLSDLTVISGQKPLQTKVKKSIAGFKIRDGWPIGAKVTLRGKRMYEFFDRLVSIVIPRIRDFRGLNDKSFDGRGNYNMGIKEQIAFPEVNYDKIDCIRGLDVAITTTACNDDHARALLLAFDFPLIRRSNS